MAVHRDAAGVGRAETEGGEEVDDREKGGEGGVAEGGVEGEDLRGVEAELVLELKKLLTEAEAGGGGGGDDRGAQRKRSEKRS